MSTPNASTVRKWDLLARVFLVLLPLLTFGPALHFEFVRWDDDNNILNNPHVASLGWSEVTWMFTDVERANRYLPLGWMTYAVERTLWGSDPFMFHLGNLVLHIINGLLLFAVLKRMLRRLGGEGREAGPERVVASALGAMFWSVNPLRAEVVAWSSASIYLMATFWFLLALWNYLDDGRSAPRKRRWAMVFYGLSLLTYPVAVLAGPTFVLLDWLVLRRLPARILEWTRKEVRMVWLEKVPFVGLSLVWVALMVLTRNRSLDLSYVDTLAVFDVPHRLAQGMLGMIYYVAKPFWPMELAPKYGNLYQFGVGEARFLVSGVLVIGVSVACLVLARRRPVFLGLWLAHLLWFLPFVGLTEYPHSFYDRYTYAAGALLSLMVALLLWAGWRRTATRWLGGGMAVAAVFFFMTLSAGQIHTWQNTAEVRLAVADALMHPELRAEHEQVAGQYYMEQQDPERAIECFALAWQHDRSEWDYRLDMGDALAALGREAQALEVFREMAALPGGEIRPRLHLGVSFCKLGRLEEGMAVFRALLEEHPGLEKAQHNLALADERRREIQDASRTTPDIRPVSNP